MICVRILLFVSSISVSSYYYIGIYVHFFRYLCTFFFHDIHIGDVCVCVYVCIY